VQIYPTIIQGALTASIIMATMPMISLIINRLIKKARVSGISFIFMLLSFIGVSLVITKGNFSSVSVNYFANFLMLLGAISWVIYTIGATYFPTFSAIKYTTLSTLYGLITIYIVTFYLIFNHVITMPTFKQIIDVWPELIFTGLIDGFVGVLAWNTGNKIITPINGILFINAVPLTAFIIIAIQGNQILMIQILGALLTICALVSNNLYQRRRLKLLP
jgi:drug/metabolite transporter (DMT)-like permease